jgi:uncharacterized protein (DUF433 family)
MKVMSAIRKHARTPKRPPRAKIEIKGVEIRGAGTGRRPYVTGTGLTVWELYHVWLDHGRNIHGVLQSLPHLNASQVYAAVAYATEHPEEEPKGCWGVKPRVPRGVKIIRI